MNSYLLFESRDPMECKGNFFTQTLADNLFQNGNKVIVFLVENAVFAARKKVFSSSFESLKKKGVEIWVDDFSLQERSLSKGKIHPDIRVQNMDAVVKCLSEGYKAFWN